VRRDGAFIRCPKTLAGRECWDLLRPGWAGPGQTYGTRTVVFWFNGSGLYHGRAQTRSARSVNLVLITIEQD
jgi:hypothetical protein